MYGLSDAQHRASRRLIWYVRAQQSVTVIVLLPGMDGTGTLSAEFVTALQPEVEALVVSYPNDPALGYTELERIARSWLPATRPFLILGESFSGPIAVSIAATQPPGLVGVVLCGSFVRNPSPSLAWLHPLFNVVGGFVPSAVTNWFLLGRFSTDRLRSALARALAQVSAATLRTRLAAVRAVDVSAQLAKLRVPVLYLRATEDRIVPAPASALVLRLLPSASIIELEAPHSM